MRFRALYPSAGEVEIDDHISGLDLGRLAGAERPYTVANFVSSLDGRASVDGRSGGLGDEGDKAVFRALRRAVDAVLVGTGTLKAENYGRILPDPAARERRIERGLRPEPLTCILTRSGALPLDIPLFSEPEAEVVVFTGRDVDLGRSAAQVDVVRIAEGELNFAAALAHLRAERRVAWLLCEGGPSVFGALLREGVADGLFLTLAAKLVGGGDGPAITGGPPLDQVASMDLAGVLERDNTLFLRYASQT